MLNKTTSNFSNIRANNHVKKNINEYIKIAEDNKVGVAIDLLINDIRKIAVDFIKQRDILETEVEKRMNQVVRDKDKGIGFDPTIRNIFAMLLANAEVYIRLLQNVHTKAFEQGEERKNVLKGLSDETPKIGAVYPWPEVKKNSAGGSKHKVVAYPGDPELVEKLKTYDNKLWPEVEFVENYQAIATKKYDTNATKEGGVGKLNFVFESDIDENKIKKISSIDSLAYGLP